MEHMENAHRKHDPVHTSSHAASDEEDYVNIDERDASLTQTDENQCECSEVCLFGMSRCFLWFMGCVNAGSSHGNDILLTMVKRIGLFLCFVSRYIHLVAP